MGRRRSRSDPGGLSREGAGPERSPRRITTLQHKTKKHGAGLGKTTGGIHRTALAMKDVQMRGNVNYEEVGDRGLKISFGKESRVLQWLEVDTIVIFAGQICDNGLAAELKRRGIGTHVIGGADEAAELHAKRAIDQGSRLAATF